MAFIKFMIELRIALKSNNMTTMFNRYKQCAKLIDDVLHSKIFMFFTALFTVVMFFIIMISLQTIKGVNVIPAFKNINLDVLKNSIAVIVVYFALIISCSLMFSKDMAILIFPIMLLPIPMFYIIPEAFTYKKLYIALAGIIGVILILKILKNIKRIKVGKFFFPILLISFIVMIGGIGTLPLKTYIQFPGIIHYLMLGPMFILMYVVVNSNLYKTERDSLKTIAYAMLFVAFALVIIIVFSHVYLFSIYVYNNGGRALLENGFSAIIKDYTFYMPWKNLTSQLLLLTIPGIFYLYNVTEKHKVWYFVAIAFIVIVGMSTMARVGVLFGVIIFAIVSAMVLINSKNSSKPLYYIVLGSIFIALFLTLFLVDSNLFDYKNILTIHKGEARIHMYKKAIETFLEHPFLGHGLLFDPNIPAYKKDNTVGMYWVHQNILQILSNFGVIGLLGYIYASVKVIKYIKKISKNEKIFGLFFLAVYFMLGLFDIVGFMAVPYEFMLVFVLAALEGKYKDVDDREVDVSQYVETDLDIATIAD